MTQVFKNITKLKWNLHWSDTPDRPRVLIIPKVKLTNAVVPNSVPKTMLKNELQRAQKKVLEAEINQRLNAIEVKKLLYVIKIS